MIFSIFQLKMLTSRTFCLFWVGFDWAFWPFEIGSHYMDQGGLHLGVTCLLLPPSVEITVISPGC